MKHTPTSKLLALAGLSAAFASISSAALINLNVSDGLGASSFAAGTNWVGGAAPTAGNTYTVGTGLRLRTPASGFTGTFAGDSLTIANGFSTGNMNGASSADLLGFSYKGTGTTGVVTVNNLILAGGSINHLNGVGDVFNLAGNLSVTADSILRAKQGPMNISAAISGSSNLYVGATDGGGARVLTFSSGSNTFNGNLILTASSALFTLADTGKLNFTIGANGVNNSVSGTGSATFNGTFNLDLTNASTNLGSSWSLVSAAVQTYGANFSIPGFTETSNVWSNGNYQFTEATGVLEVIPEPSTWAALVGLSALGFAAVRRRKS